MKILPRLVVALCALPALGLAAAETPAVARLTLEPALFAGRPAAEVLKTLAERPSDQASATGGFALASVELLAAVEALCQDLHRLGLNYQFARELPVPIFRLALPPHPNPEIATPEKVRAVLERFKARLSGVDERLASLPPGEFQVVLPLGAAGLDFDGDGEITAGEEFSRFFEALNRRAPVVVPPDAVNAAAATLPDPRDLTVGFDRADVSWLRAYANLLQGVIDVWLAHDGGALFASTGHLFFVRADTALARELPKQTEPGRANYGSIADVVALIHGLSLPVTQPGLLAEARGHLLAACKHSRATLEAIAAETDNDREWLPGPAQDSVFGLRLSQAQADGWRTLLTEVEDILEGKKLLPHWRFRDGRGVNLKRLFLESRDTDLVLLIQGAAAIPYLENGELTRGTTWQGIVRLFQGDFIGYAFWIN